MLEQTIFVQLQILTDGLSNHNIRPSDKVEVDILYESYYCVQTYVYILYNIILLGIRVNMR